jgi:hypothetical protein
LLSLPRQMSEQLNDVATDRADIRSLHLQVG